MSELSEDEVQEILANWAEDSRELPPPVRDVYDAWCNFRFAEIKSAIEAMSADDDFACEMGEGQCLQNINVNSDVRHGDANQDVNLFCKI